MKWCQGLLLTVEKKMTTKRSFCSDIVNIVRKAKHFFVQFLTKKSDFSREKSNHIYKRFFVSCPDLEAS